MAQTLRNGVTMFTNGDTYKPAEDLTTAFNTANVVIKVSSQSAENTLKAALNNTTDKGTPITRTDLPGSPVSVWDGTTFMRVVASNHLEIGLTAGANTANSLWGPGSPATMTAGIDAARSVNTGAFTFPANNAITVANDGIYEVSWYMYDFSAPASGYIILTNLGGTLKHSSTGFTGVSDISLPAIPNLRLLAGETLSFNFQTTTSISCKHRIRLTKK